MFAQGDGREKRDIYASAGKKRTPKLSLRGAALTYSELVDVRGSVFVYREAEVLNGDFADVVIKAVAEKLDHLVNALRTLFGEITSFAVLTGIIIEFYRRIGSERSTVYYTVSPSDKVVAL